MGDIGEDKKLIWLGLKRAQQDTSEARDHIDRLQRGVEYDDYEDAVSGFADDSDHKTWLIDEDNADFTEDQADSFNEMIQNNFESWSDYQDFVVNEAGSYITLRNGFDTQTAFESEERTADGEAVAGVRLHDTDGVSYAGVSVPAGTVEIYGNRVEFSRTGPPDAEEADISFSNLSISNTTPTRYETITISADVSNTGDSTGAVYAPLLEDGDVVTRQRIEVAAGATETVEFERRYTEFQSMEVTIKDLPEQKVVVVHEGLIQ